MAKKGGQMGSLHDAAGASLSLESYTRSGIWPNGEGELRHQP